MIIPMKKIALHGQENVSRTVHRLWFTECAKQFHARPLPDTTYRPLQPAWKHSVKEPTTPSPFRLRSEERCSRRKTTTTNQTSSPEPPSKTTNRSEPRRQSPPTKGRKTSSANLNTMKQRIASAKRSERRSTTCSTVPTPFRLQTEIRGDAYQASFEEKKKREEEEMRRRQSLDGWAKPAPASPPPAPKRSDRKSTEPQPFRIQSLDRHERYQSYLRAKSERMEAERKRLSSVPKAAPVPHSTYQPAFAPVLPSQQGRKPLMCSPPALQTEAQAKSRKVFDETIQRQREEEEAKKHSMEEHKRLELEQQMRELRRLPVEEGGFQFKAKPVNAVLSERNKMSVVVPAEELEQLVMSLSSLELE